MQTGISLHPRKLHGCSSELKNVSVRNMNTQAFLCSIALLTHGRQCLRIRRGLRRYSENGGSIFHDLNYTFIRIYILFKS